MDVDVDDVPPDDILQCIVMGEMEGGRREESVLFLRPGILRFFKIVLLRFLLLRFLLLLSSENATGGGLDLGGCWQPNSSNEKLSKNTKKSEKDKNII